MHSRYHRHLSDTATAGQEVLIRLRVRRLFCDNADCVKTTFAEQVPELASRHARRTPLLQRVLAPPLTALTSHVLAFTTIMCSLRGHDLEMVKRQMFGRAKPDLLHKRVLLTA